MKHFSTTVLLYRPVKGHPGQSVECRVDLAIDVDRLFIELGNRAIRNKSKRAIDIGGLVECVVNIKGGT